MNYFFFETFIGGKRLFRSFSIALAFALLASTARAQQCHPAPAGIVAWWSAENNALDNIGFNNGVLSGTAGYAPGIVGQAFNFLNVGDQASFTTTGFPVGTSDRTMECWIYVASFISGDETVFAGYGDFGTDGAIYYLGADTSQQIFFSQWGQSIIGPAINSNQWYHIAVTSIGNDLITLYLNGTNVATGSLPFSTPDGTSLYLGEVTAPYATRQLIGEIDELSIYNRALASNEIQAIYNAGSAGKCIPPKFSLSATTPGGGNITVNPTNTPIVAGTIVTLTATPSDGWTFLQWLGDAAGANASTSVTMDRAKSVQAIFGTTVSNVVDGNGSIVFNPPWRHLSFWDHSPGQRHSANRKFFVLWDDSASGTANPLAFPVTNANPGISALFVGLGGGEVSLAVVPVGHGTVSVNPQDNSYASGYAVTVTATPDASHAFVGWSGGVSGANNPLSIQLSQNETIYANFTTNDNLLIYPVTPPGTADGVALDIFGEFGAHYRLDASSDLVNWTNLYDLTNDVGTLHYIDPCATNLPHRYYRAVTLP